MPEFHETVYGRTFFQSQLPDLIRNLGRIADAMEQQNKRDETKLFNAGVDAVIEAVCDKQFSENYIVDEVVNFMEEQRK